jgi:phosphoglycerate kinase
MIVPYAALNEADLAGKTLIMRVDFNSPIEEAREGLALRDTTRIDDHLRTSLTSLFELPRPPRNIVLLAHQGRPGRDDCTTLLPHFAHCRDKLRLAGIETAYVWEGAAGKAVRAMGEAAVASADVLARIRSLADRTVLLLENVRFSEAESHVKGDEPSAFANTPLIRMLAEVDNRVVALDGFSVAHRAQASVVGLASLGPLYAGPVVMREIEQLSQALENPKSPMLLIVGGAKVDDSLGSMRYFLEQGKADLVITGGLVGLVLLQALGRRLNEQTETNMAAATRDLPQTVARAEALMKRFGRNRIRVPADVALGPQHGSAAQRAVLPVERIDPRDPRHIGDIGLQTIAQYTCDIAQADTLVMNGPMGRYEWPCFARGNEEVLRYAAYAAQERNAHVLVGGGDTGASLGALPAELVGHVKVCSSGKAFLEVLATGTVESLIGVRMLARR